MNRQATHSFAGYIYQRRYCIFLLLRDNSTHYAEKAEKIVEEGYEDIDITLYNGTKDIYQCKHHSSKDPIGFSKKSPLIKTILSNYNADKINSIVYSICGTGNVFTNELHKLLIENNYEEIANKCTEVIKSSHKPEIDKDICCDTHEGVLNFLSNKDKYVTFFKKIKYVKQEDIKELNTNIYDLIKRKYKIHFLHNDYDTLKLYSIIYSLDNKLNEKLFGNLSNEQNREIYLEDVGQIIDDILNKFNNLAGIYGQLKLIYDKTSKITQSELINSLDIIIKQYINNNGAIFNLTKIILNGSALIKYNEQRYLIILGIINLIMHKYVIYVRDNELTFDDWYNFINTIRSIYDKRDSNNHRTIFKTHHDLFIKILGNDNI